MEAKLGKFRKVEAKLESLGSGSEDRKAFAKVQEKLGKSLGKWKRNSKEVWENGSATKKEYRKVKKKNRKNFGKVKAKLEKFGKLEVKLKKS